MKLLIQPGDGVAPLIKAISHAKTSIQIVIFRFGMRSDTFFRLFSRAPRIVIYSWDTIRSFSYLTIPQAFPQYIVSGVEYHPPGSADPNVKFADGKAPPPNQGAMEPEPDSERQRQVVEVFSAAAHAGDFEALQSVLDPEVVLRADRGPASRGIVGVDTTLG